MTAMPEHPLHAPILGWYAAHARDLPWRDPGCSPWGVLVSEIMLQQTPVARVLPAWQRWMERWPRPVDLAKDAPGEAIRRWDRLGYPRRALRLHAAATAIVDRHGGEVPDRHEDLLALPGIGTYTAAAVASFAFGQRHAVVDTNVRRVFARAVTGEQYPAPALTAAESRLAATLLPDDDATAARWAVATMEFGALVCTARSPRCDDCPVRSRCAWRLAGSPAHDGPARRGQTYAGTDRWVRGLLLAALRAAHDAPTEPGVLTRAALDAAAPDTILRDPLQRDRCLAGLIDDGLVEPLAGDRFRLPA